MRMEKYKGDANNSVQINITNKSKENLLTREKPFEGRDPTTILKRTRVHKEDIKRLEEKIKQLDNEIRETENIRKEVYRSNSISTHETEMDEESVGYHTPVPERKSMQYGVKNTLGQIRGLITHMVDLVNKDPSVTPALSSELSSLVKFKAELKSDKETPSVIKKITTFADKTPALLDSVQSLKAAKRQVSK